MDNDAFARLAYGIYLVADDGEILRCPTRAKARSAALDWSAEGVGCRIVNVEERYDPLPPDQEDDDGRGGSGAPFTLYPPVALNVAHVSPA